MYNPFGWLACSAMKFSSINLNLICKSNQNRYRFFGFLSFLTMDCLRQGFPHVDLVHLSMCRTAAENGLTPIFGSDALLFNRLCFYDEELPVSIGLFRAISFESVFVGFAG